MPILPPEMIEYIFKFTDKFTLQTCLEISYFTEMVQRELRRRYKNCLHLLIKLGFDETEAKIQLNKGKIDLYGPNSNHIYPNVTDTCVITLAMYCPYLTAIYLDVCCDITNASIIALANYCPELTIIGLHNCTNITDASIMTLIKKCPKLKRINTTYCNITNYTRQFLLGRRIRIR